MDCESIYLKATTLAGLASRGSTPSSVTAASAMGTYHFNSNVNLSLPDALYFAQAITSLKRKRCLSFLWPSESSTTNEFFTNLRWALSWL